MRSGFFALVICGTVFIAASCDSTPPLRPELVQSNSNAQQDGTVAEPVATLPSVRVTTSGGQPVPGVDVTFAVTSGGGTTTAAPQKTDQAGIATVSSWVLGNAVGTNTLTASVAGIATTVVFTAEAGPAAPAQMLLFVPVAGEAQSGSPLPVQPVIELRDRFNNLATKPSVPVSVELASGAGQLTGVTTVATNNGRAVFGNISINGTGTFSLRFFAPGIDPIVTPSFQVIPAIECPAARRVDLDLTLGQIARHTMDDTNAPTCLSFDLTRNSGQQYLVLFENMPLYGSYTTSVFSGPQSDNSFQLRLRPGSSPSGNVMPTLALAPATAPPHAVHMWDFGEGPIYEIEPELPTTGVAAPRLLRSNGSLVDLNTTTVDPVVGDTLVVRLEGIPRLTIPTGNQKVVIRYISSELIIAEDSRLATLTRENGLVSTPLTDAQMAAIASEYALHARVQGDRMFEGRFNSSIEGVNSGRIVAVHTLMSSNNIWGYTYSTGNYFAWDFWVGTNGSTAGSNQQPQRVADNVMMHEAAHLRHAGLMQRNGMAWQDQFRGHRWVVEGFARFTERLPIAARLLGTTAPSRVNNLTLPLNPIFNGSYFRDDVPTFLNAGTPMFDGYAASSFVFDYFADQVALQGGDWLVALREFLLAAGNPETLDAAIQRYIPGITFEQLFTRARIALYTDDIGYTLPAWTQYHQFNLRTSRPPGSGGASVDPRNAWVKLVPGAPLSTLADITAGGALGYVIDGSAAGATTSNLVIEAPLRPNAVMSITRIR